MINGMYLSTMGAMVEMAKHETVANNLANSETTGFKPDFATFMAIPAESVFKGLGRRESDLILEKTGGGVWLDRTTSDFTPGPLRETQNPLNLAINDENGRVSFFKVRTGAGENEQIRYTRNGNFTLNNEGMIVTDGGLPVLSDTDQPIILPRTTGQIGILANGDVTIVENGEPALFGRIGLASTTLAEAQGGLRKLGSSLYEPDGAQMENGGGTMLSGMLEESSTNPINEMMKMIEGHRAYELNMRFLSMQDQSLGTAISKLTAK